MIGIFDLPRFLFSIILEPGLDPADEHLSKKLECKASAKVVYIVELKGTVPPISVGVCLVWLVLPSRRFVLI